MARAPWKPKEFIYEFTDEDLTASAGLGPLIDLFVASPQYAKLRECLPERKSNAGYDTEDFALSLLSGFWYGHDSLDDLEEFDQDPSVEDKLDGLPSARAVGDWLRDFTPEMRERLNRFLTRQALSCRKELGNKDPVTIDTDSTAHEQSGVKMEGLETNYDGKWCLDSLVAFDELGLSYRMDLRPGSTFSATGAPAMIEGIFSNFSFQEEKHFRGDSAFCNEEVIRSCLAKGAKFTITMHGNTGWENRVPEITSWSHWVYSKDNGRVRLRLSPRWPEEHNFGHHGSLKTRWKRPGGFGNLGGQGFEPTTSRLPTEKRKALVRLNSHPMGPAGSTPTRKSTPGKRK